MRWRDLVFLFVIALIALVAGSRWVSSPGYMDAEYYYAGGMQLAGGNGFQEPFLWNYLDFPIGIPHPSHTYWMPLPSLVAAAGMAVGRSLAFHWAQLPFLILAALIAPLTAQIAFRLTQVARFGWLAGLLAVFSGFYLNLLVITETFALYMVLGSAFLLIAFPVVEKKRLLRIFLLGLITGLMHLSRADGLLWLIAVGGVIAWWAQRRRLPPASVALLAILALIGYLLVMAPWYARNLVTYDSLFSPGGSRTLWLTEYNHTFLYPADQLTPDAWWQAGIQAHMDARLWALGFNLKNLIGAQMLVVLLPMVILGSYRLRKHPIVIVAICMWLVTLAVMTVVFPFAGARGGYMHSSAALQPVFWAVSPLGLSVLIEWGERRRGWDKEQAFKVFSTALIVITCLLTFVLFWTRVVGPDSNQPVWGAESRRYARVDRVLQSMNIGEDEIIMVNNPPGFFLETGRPSIVIPGGDLSSVLSAAGDYGARALVLEPVQENLIELYDQPTLDAELMYQTTVDEIHIFLFSVDSVQGDGP